MTQQHTCPECSGPRLYALTFRHVPNGCGIGAVQDATKAADHDRLTGAAWSWGLPKGHAKADYVPARYLHASTIYRRPTPAETVLMGALTGTTPGAESVAAVVQWADGVHRVYVDGVDLDAEQVEGQP